MQNRILNLRGGEAIGPLTLASGENLLDRHRLVAQDAERHTLGGVVGVLVRLTLGVHTLILGVDLVPQSVHISDGLTIDHSDDHLKNVLLHSVVSFLVCWVFLPFDVFIIAPIGYNVKLRVC